jgi:hypothetical protein
MRAPGDAPSVFVSYAHDSVEHKGLVRHFCTLLQSQGVRVCLDQWDDDGRKDWSSWAMENLDHDFVLVIASPDYQRRAEGRTPPHEGRGTQWESAILRDRLTQDRPYWTRRILPVVLPGRAVSEIPAFLTPYSTTRYEVEELTADGVAYLLGALHAVAADPTPPLGHYDGSGLPRVIATDRDSLAPQTLDPVARSALLRAALARRDNRRRVDGRRQLLVLVGEGGIGKSVLLGQLLQRFTDSGDDGTVAPDNDQDHEAGAVVLVAAASVVPGALADGVTAADHALGVAAHSVLGQAGLLALLRTLRAGHGQVTLLLDTLDLLLDHATLASLAAVLGEAVEIGEVVITCRTQEFTGYLRDAGASAPRLANRITEYPLPVLAPTEIVDWARRHLAAHPGETADHEAFLRSLEGGVTTTGSLRQVCALPVRLALTCQAFAELGRVPEDLTVTGLYRAYWGARVRRHAGTAGSPQGDRKELSALHVARHVVTSDGGIRLRVPKGLLGTDDLVGLRLLASEGVLRDHGTSWEFFHQTFAEYAHGRWLLSLGVDSPEVAELAARLATGHANLWPLARTLLLQTDTYQDYQQLIQVLPSDSVDAAHVRALGAVQRPEPEAVAAVLDDLVAHPTLLRAALPAFGDVPRRHRPVVFARMLAILRTHPRALGDLAIAAVVSMLSRSAPANWLRQAADTVLDVKGHLGQDAWDNYHERLTQPYAHPPVDDAVVEMLGALYPRFGPLGRRGILRVLLAAGPTEAQLAPFARVALTGACPPLPDGELVAFMTLLWRSPSVRAGRGWTNWRDLLAEPLPPDWNNGQIKLVVHLAGLDQSLADEVIDDVLRGQLRTPEPHVAVLEQYAATHAPRVADRLLAAEPPRSLAALNGLGKSMTPLAAGVSAATRARLASWLESVADAAPRTVWPSLVVLAADDLTHHQALMTAAAAAPLAPAVRQAVLTTWISHTPRPTLDGLLDALRRLTTAADRETRQLRARLEGRVVDTDPAARHWIATQVLTGRSAAVAGTAVKTIADTFGTPSAAIIGWLCGLLRTPHTDAARRLAELLADTDLSLVTGRLTPIVLDRLRTAASPGEDSMLSRALLELLIRIDHHTPLDEPAVLAIYTTVRARLPLDLGDLGSHRTNDHSAALRDLTTLSGTLMANRLPSDQVRTLFTDLLRSLDPAHLGAKMVRTVRALVRSIAGRDPQAVPWLEQVFVLPDIAVEVRLAIADALLALDGNAPDGRAAQLKNHPTCPPEVAAHIVARTSAT